MTAASGTNDTDLRITWNAVDTDIYGHPLRLDRYRIYRSSDPLFVPDQVGRTNLLLETTNRFAVVTNAFLEDSSSFFYVAAVDANDQESPVFTELASHVARPVSCPPGGTGFHLLWLPYQLPWTNAAALAGQLPPAVRLSKLSPANSGFDIWHCRTATGVNFAVQGGDAIGVEVTNSCVLHMVGLHDPGRWNEWLTGAGDARRQRWLSLPPQAPYATAHQVAAAVGPATKVARWDAGTGAYRSWFRLADQWRGENFVIPPGEGLYVSLDAAASNVAWRPALPYPRVTVAVARGFEFAESANGLRATALVADDEGDIVEYRWDGDGDGVVDATSVTPVLNYTRVPTNGVTWYPSLWVRDRRGFLGLGYDRYEALSLAVTVTNQFLQPPQGSTIRYVSSTNGTFTTTIRDGQGRTIRVLETNAWHEAGPVTVAWDGAGAPAPGAYYVVIAQQVGTNTATYDPAALRAGSNAAVPVSGFSTPAALDLRAGGRFPIVYTLGAPAWVTVRMMSLENAPLAVICTNAPRSAGTHEEFWDGRLSTGSLVSPEERFQASVEARALEPNTLILQTPLPRIEALTPSANRFLPALNPYGAETNAVVLSYRLATGADVRMQVWSSSGRLVRSVLETGKPAGANQTLWNGTDDHDRLVAEGYYSIELRSEAAGAQGERSQVWTGVYY